MGWPPIRSFRKNLASSSSSKPTSESQNLVQNKIPGEKSVETKGKGLFVKINMDGVPIGRKVDLKAYDSYDKLSSAVDELFRGLLAGIYFIIIIFTSIIIVLSFIHVINGQSISLLNFFLKYNKIVVCLLILHVLISLVTEFFKTPFSFFVCCLLLCLAQRDSSAGGIQNNQEKEKAITGLLDGSGEYTLVYEDNEGDRMLVGDVPWQ